MRLGRRIAASLIAAALAGGVAGAAAQEVDPPATYSPSASPLLEARHWSVQAARRLEALGLAPYSLATQAPLPRHVVAEVLRHAAAQQPSGAVAELAAGWWARFQEEFGEYEIRPEGGASPQLLGGSAGVGYSRAWGPSAPGRGVYVWERTGARELPDLQEARLAFHIAAAPVSGLVVDALPALTHAGVRLERLEVNAAWRNWGLSLGRGPVGYGAGEGGGVVLSAHPAMDRAQFSTVRPLRLPGRLGALGPVGFSTLLATLPEDRHPGEPVFWGARGSANPHPRLLLTIQRGAMLGGEHVADPITPWALLKALVGKHASIENQIVSAGIRYRLPLERWLATTAYCEWGAEDSSGAMISVPGLLCGVMVPSVPGLPWMELGTEHAYFGQSCCGNPPWYRHGQFPGGWALDSGPLGHPLGGAGTERLVFGRSTLLDARLEVEARAFRRERRSENLFVPGREGVSLGWHGGALMRLGPSSAIEVEGGREAGDNWSEAWLTVQSRILF